MTSILEWYSNPSEASVKARHIGVACTNYRSPFYGLDPGDLAGLFQACGAEYARTLPFATNGGRNREGTVIFRQHKEQTYIYIPLTGAVVSFEARGLTSAESLEGRLGASISIGELFAGFDYASTVAPGEVAGLTGLFLSFLKYLHDHGTQSSAYSPRRDALSKSPLIGLAGKWVLSGMASNSAQIVRIEVKRLLELIVNDGDKERKWADFVGTIIRDGSSDVRLSRHNFLRRCCEEATLRQAQQRYRASLISRAKHGQLLAIHLYEYFERTGKTRIGGTNKKIAWYLNLHDDDAIADILKEMGDGLVWRLGKSKTQYSFDPERLLAYYQAYLSNLA